MKRYILIRVFVLTLGALAVTVARGQNQIAASAQADLAKSDAAKSDAKDAIKDGKPQAAIDALRSGVRSGPGAPNADVQVVASLCGIATALACERNAESQNAAQLAITEGAKVTGSAEDRAYVASQLGELYERTIGDRTKARSQYQLALSLDPKRKEAAQGLWRIARLEALIADQVRQSNQLRAGGK